MNLPIYSVALRALGSDECELTLKTGLTTPAGIGIHMKDSLLHLYNVDDDSRSSFIDLMLPGQELEGETNITISRQKTTILDEDGFAQFVGDVFRGTEAVVGVRGKIKAGIGKLPPSNLNIDKRITLKGFDSLQGLGFEDLRAGAVSEPNRVPLSGTVLIPVSGDVELMLGNVTLNILAGSTEEELAGQGLVIGEAKITDMVLAPGNNSLPFLGDIFVDAVLENPGTILRILVDTTVNGEVELATTGKMAEANGERITWLESTLNNEIIMSRIPIGELLTDLLGGIVDTGNLGDIVKDIFD